MTTEYSGGKSAGVCGPKKWWRECVGRNHPGMVGPKFGIAATFEGPVCGPEKSLSYFIT